MRQFPCLTLVLGLALKSGAEVALSATSTAALGPVAGSGAGLP